LELFRDFFLLPVIGLIAVRFIFKDETYSQKSCLYTKQDIENLISSSRKTTRLFSQEEIENLISSFKNP
jgi:hypothetical protein